MGFLTLLQVASMPIMQVLIISILGALMATEYLNLLPADTRKTLNKVVTVCESLKFKLFIPYMEITMTNVPPFLIVCQAKIVSS